MCVSLCLCVCVCVCVFHCVCVYHPPPLPSTSQRYTNTLLKRVAAGGICYSVSRKCFISRTALPFKAEEYTDMNGEYTDRYGEYTDMNGEYTDMYGEYTDMNGE